MSYFVEYFREHLGSPDTLRGQLVRGGVGSLTINITHNLLTLAMTIVLARILGAANYGVYAYVYALVSILTMPAQFGLPPLIVRVTARSHAVMEWGTIKGVFRWSNFIAILLSIAVVLIVGGIAVYFAAQFSLPQLETLAWGLILMPLLVLGNLRGAALRGLRKVVQSQLTEKILRPGFFTISILCVALLYSGDELTAQMAMALHALSAGLAFLIGAWLLQRARPREVNSAKPLYESRRWMKSVIPLALTAGMLLVNQYTDILMLGIFRSSEEVGIYRVSMQGAMLVTFGISAIAMVVSPYIARFHAQGDLKRLQKLLTLTARFGAAVALVFFVIYVFLGDRVLSLFFGNDYVLGLHALVILSFGRLANAVAGPVVFLFNMTGHERRMARSVAFAMAVNIFLNFLLIPSFGMEGAAAASAITLIAWNFLLCRTAHKILGVDTSVFGFSEANRG